MSTSTDDSIANDQCIMSHAGLSPVTPMIAAPGLEEPMTEADAYEPDVDAHFRPISGYPKALAGMLALCASDLVQLGEDPYQIVKIARHGVSHGYYAGRDLIRDANAILAELPPNLAGDANCEMDPR